MRVLALDDSELSLKQLVQSINEVVPEAEVFSFGLSSELIKFAAKNPCDIAFLDIQIWGTNGLEVAKALKDIYPKINIIFVTANKKNAKNVFEQHSSGFILKPVSKKAIQREIENLKSPFGNSPQQALPSIPAEAKIRVQTFGSFDVFFNGKPLAFSRLKAKEAFAYLINRKGSSVTVSELASVLWEGKDYDRSLQNQTQVIISCLMKTLKDNEISDIIIKEYNQISVDKIKIKCDYFDFLNWDITAVNSYAGEYMTNYSWAVMTTNELN